MNAIYYVSYANCHPASTRAKSLQGAMRAAERNCIYTGQPLYVSVRDGAEFRVVATRLCDSLNMNTVGRWVQVNWQ